MCSTGLFGFGLPAFFKEECAQHNLPADDECSGGNISPQAADDQRADGFSDGNNCICLAVVHPAEGEQVGAEDHGIDHEHGVRVPAEGPHDDQQIQELVERVQQAEVFEGVLRFAEDIRLYCFCEQNCQGHQQAAADEGRHVRNLQVRAENACQQDQRPEDDRGEHKGKAFLHEVLGVLFQQVQLIDSSIHFVCFHDVLLFIPASCPGCCPYPPRPSLPSAGTFSRFFSPSQGPGV